MPSEWVNALKLSASIAVLVALIYHLLRKSPTEGRRHWPTIPHMILLMLGWWARWWMLLYWSFDEFLVHWRMRREQTPVKPRTQNNGYQKDPPTLVVMGKAAGD